MSDSHTALLESGTPVDEAASSAWMSDDAILAVCDAAGFTKRQMAELMNVRRVDGIEIQVPTFPLKRFVQMLIAPNAGAVPRRCGECTLFDHVPGRKVRCRVVPQIRPAHALRPMEGARLVSDMSDASGCRFFTPNSADRV